MTMAHEVTHSQEAQCGAMKVSIPLHEHSDLPLSLVLTKETYPFICLYLQNNYAVVHFIHCQNCNAPIAVSVMHSM